MRVIFLDVDGVLVTRWSFSPEGRGARQFGYEPAFDPRCVEQLNRITDVTGAMLVLSSTWRLGRRLIDLREQFLQRGVKQPLMACTPRLVEDRGTIAIAQPRGAEIARYLEDADGARHVDQFVILDDDDDMEPVKHRLVLTNYRIGLTAADADRAIALMENGGAQ